MFKVLFLLIQIHFLTEVKCELFSAGFSSDYSYDENSLDGPSNWGRISPNCLGHQQSPINLLDNIVGPVPFSLSLSNFNLKATETTMTNDGKTVEMTFRYPFNQQATMSGPILHNEMYIVHSVHFHWGANDLIGSEHQVNWQTYPGEIHIVSYNARYGSLENAVSIPGGLAVLGTFFTVDESSVPRDLISLYYFNNVIPNFASNSATNYLNFLPNIAAYNSSITLTGNNAVSLFDIIKQNPVSYYSYRGSLTTPNCEESVIWLVNRLPVLITQRDLQNFRSLQDKNGNGIFRNWRPLQKLNHRFIKRFL
jgi:carbonic anhydrase